MISKGYVKTVLLFLFAFTLCTSSISIGQSSAYQDNKPVSDPGDNSFLQQYHYDPVDQIISFNVSFQDPIITYDQDQHQTVAEIKIGNLSNTDCTDYPNLPVRTIHLLIPPCTDLGDINVDKKTSSIQLLHPLRVGNQGSESISLESFRTSKDGNDDWYPIKNYEIVGTTSFRGYQILIINLYPVQYCQKDNEIMFSSSISLSFSFLKNQKDPQLLRNIIHDRDMISGKIINPSMLSCYDSLASSYEDLDDAIYQYVIITNIELEPYFEPLVNYKNDYISTTVVNLSFITSSFYGQDLQDRIRQFIQYAYLNWQTEYVLLGGDVSIIPYRGLWGEGIDHEGALLHDEDIPSDIYYACLDGSWDDDGDHIYGESIEYSVKDEADFSAEVFVGRAPVETKAEVGTFINKVITFETSEKPHNILLHQSGVNSKNDPDSSVIPENCAKWIPDEYDVDRLYQVNQIVTSEMWMDHFSDNNLIVEHTGNGAVDRYFLTWPTNTFSRYESISTLENDFFPIHTSVSCNSGAFDKDDCIAETILLNPYGGASACLFNSRMGFTSSSNAHKYTGEFIEQQFYQIFKENTAHIGKVHQYAKEQYLVNAFLYPEYRWCYYTINLLGDPEMPIFEVRADYLNSSTFYVDDDYNSSTVGWNVTHFNSIQQGISAASNWDIIRVNNGIYNERLTIRKTIRLIGQQKEKTVIDGANGLGTLRVSADRVKISNFTIRNDKLSSDSCRILISGTNYVTISNCIISENNIGVYISDANNIFLDNNIFRKNYRGIFATLKSKNVFINDNTFSIDYSDGFGIYAKGNGHYEIKNNSFSSDLDFYHFCCGIYTNGETIIESNEISGCTMGIWLYDGDHRVRFNEVSDCKQTGIISFSSSVDIEGNTIVDNGNNFIGSDYLIDCQPGGICMYGSPLATCKIRNNDIKANKGFGLYLEGLLSLNNEVSENDFIDNSIHAFFRNSHCWWNNNYWEKNKAFPKFIIGVYELGSFIKLPMIQVDIHPAVIPVN